MRELGAGALRAPPWEPWRELGVAREVVKLPGFVLGRVSPGWLARRARLPRLLDLARGLAQEPLPRGSATVLVIPGFRTGDEVTWVLRRSLSALGHRVHGWALGMNHGDVPALLPRLVRRVLQLADEGPIHLVGWSLGGFLAREVARDHPELVAQVLTLGSPVTGGPKYTAAAGYYRKRLGVDLDELERSIAARDEVPIRVPVTAIFSPIDAVVCPAACVDTIHRHVEHRVVDCCHFGMGFSPEVLTILAERLSRPLPGEGELAAQAPMRKPG